MKPSGGDFRGYLARLLDRGVYTRRQLEERLRKRGASEEESGPLLDEMEELGFVDDGLYARLFVEAHPERGSLRLKDDLRRRGVGQSLIEEVLAERDDGTEERAALELAREWRERGVELRLIAARLLRRGFPSAIVRLTLDRLERKAP
ncbi:MAG: RecX family transcriptional regulator [Synergistaceae bacterium]|jgi:regulatory protein|nr:RecX family transcriptional regulator [Synergistaceae bacterium]